MNARSWGQGRGQIFEAEAEAEDKILASRPAWPQKLNITGNKQAWATKQEGLETLAEDRRWWCSTNVW